LRIWPHRLLGLNRRWQGATDQEKEFRVIGHEVPGINTSIHCLFLLSLEQLANLFFAGPNMGPQMLEKLKGEGKNLKHTWG
jgi:hypothetical protein